MPNTSTARSKAIISMVLSLRVTETPTDIGDPHVTRRYKQSDIDCPAQCHPHTLKMIEPDRVSDRQSIRTVREKFLDSIPARTAGRWADRLALLAGGLRFIHGLRPRKICKRPLLAGITLVHTADTFQASPGQRITFTAWVMNDTSKPLSQVSVIPRSFTNAGMEDLSYTTEPAALARCLNKLWPGETASWTFTYLVTERDLSHGGSLLSAMGVQARNPAAVTLWDECDAEVFLTPA